MRNLWYKVKDLTDTAVMWLVFNVLPRSFVTWSFVRVAAHATCGKWGHESPSNVDVMTALKRFDESNKEV